jgi:hypothetical protein
MPLISLILRPIGRTRGWLWPGAMEMLSLNGLPTVLPRELKKAQLTLIVTVK